MMRNRRGTWVVVAAALALGSAGSYVADASRAVHQDAPMQEFVGGAEAGTANLTRTQSGVTLRVATSVSGELEAFGTPLGVDWMSGDATTVWIVVFNDPGNCVGGCGEDDVIDAIFGDNRAGVGVHYGAGHVAGGATFQSAAHLSEGDDGGALFGLALEDAMTAEIHTVVRSHGPATSLTGAELAAALHTVDGGCAPDFGPNTCGDSQFAVFLSP